VIAMAKRDKNNQKKIGLSALPVGIVSAVIGYVAIKGLDGIERLLKSGDKLFSGDEINSGDDGHAVIDLIDGSKVELDQQSSLVLDDDVIDAKTLEQIQQAIIAGISPAAGDVSSQGGFNIAQVQINAQPGDDMTSADSADYNQSDFSIAQRSDSAAIRPDNGPGAIDSGTPQNPIGKLPTLSIANVVVVEPAPAGSGGQGGPAGQGGHETDSVDHDTSHDEGGDSADSGHDSGGDSHDGGHDTGGDSEDIDHGDSGHDSGHDQGPVYAVFTITLSHPALTDVSIDFSTADGTAVSGGHGVDMGDYGHTSGTLIIPAGETSGTIEVEILGDRGVESDSEYFYLNLSNAHGATIADGQATATIIDSGHGEGSTGEGDILVGTPGDDVLTGSGGRDSIFGGAGNDTISGRGGPDTLMGEDGDDIILGLGGPDLMSGGAGNDDMQGHGGPDVMDGGAGDDIISGGGAPDTINGGEGNDDIYGGGGPDLLNGGPGNDSIHGEGGPDNIDGGPGNDTIYGDGGPDTIDGGAGNDTIYGGGGPDIIDGGSGDNILVGGGAGDVFRFDNLEGSAIPSRITYSCRPLPSLIPMNFW